MSYARDYRSQALAEIEREQKQLQEQAIRERTQAIKERQRLEAEKTREQLRLQREAEAAAERAQTAKLARDHYLSLTDSAVFNLADRTHAMLELAKTDPELNAQLPTKRRAILQKLCMSYPDVAEFFANWIKFDPQLGTFSIVE